MTAHGRFDPARTLERRIAFYRANVDVRGPDECWPWLRALTDGYGQLRVVGTSAPAHRFGYELARGPVPAGHTLDHDCHTRDLSCPGGVTCPHRACQNPTHLVPMPLGENVALGNLSRVARAGRSRVQQRTLSTTPCNQPECAGMAYIRGMCHKHYTRWRRHGDPSVSKR